MSDGTYCKSICASAFLNSTSWSNLPITHFFSRHFLYNFMTRLWNPHPHHWLISTTKQNTHYQYLCSILLVTRSTGIAQTYWFYKSMRLDDISSKISKWVTDKFPNINFEWYGKYCQNVYTPIRGGLQEKINS